MHAPWHCPLVWEVSLWILELYIFTSKPVFSYLKMVRSGELCQKGHSASSLCQIKHVDHKDWDFNAGSIVTRVNIDHLQCHCPSGCQWKLCYCWVGALGGSKEEERSESRGKRTLNVGIMTTKGRKLVDMMERRNVDTLCVQETKLEGKHDQEHWRWIQAVLLQCR